MPALKSNDSRSSPRSHRLLTVWRFAWRLPGLLALLLLGLLLTVLLGNPLTGRRGLLPVRWWQPMLHAWSTAMLRLFGFRIHRHGTAVADPVLLVANHVSWLDIQAIHSQRAASFVAKSEISRWPVLGWLARQAGTVFHRRGDAQSLQSVMTVMRERLRAGQSVIVFPEGGTGRGDRVRPFHARILQVALDTGVPIQPVALVYGRDGRMDLSVPFRPGETFLANALRLLGQAPMAAHVHFLPPLTPGDQGRRQLADSARSGIATVVDGAVPVATAGTGAQVAAGP